MKNRFNPGDIVYTVDVNKYLIVSVNKMIVDKFYVNDDRINYQCLGLEHSVIRTYELPESEEKEDGLGIYGCCIRDERNPPQTISTTTNESSLFFEEELNEAILKVVEERREQNEKIREAEDKFRCPLTGGKIIELKHDYLVLDGPSKYKVEGSNIIWQTYPRDWNPRPFHTRYNGKDYSFKYLGNGNWRELILITGANGGGMYVDKVLYNSGDENVKKEVVNFLLEQKKRKEKWDSEKSLSSSVLFPIMKRVKPSLVTNELIEVVPMSPPTRMLFYMGYKEEKIKIEINREKEYEINLDKFNNWDLVPFEDGFMFGNSFIKVIK